MMNDASLWYEAFNKNDPSMIDRILSPNWVDIPAAPQQPAGPAGAKVILAELTTAFPDCTVKIEDTLRVGNKVIVRSKITGTQKGAFMGFPAKDRVLSIQAIDIHEFENGKIIRTWHTEDWLTGLHQLGVLGK
jgi:steroid delta-isomerase-like uncharacterized protein